MEEDYFSSHKFYSKKKFQLQVINRRNELELARNIFKYNSSYEHT